MYKESLLWKLEGGSLTAPSYLFGSMHVRDHRAFQRLAKVYEAIGECNGFATEFHLEPAKTELTANAMQLANGQRISDLFPAKNYRKYRNVLLKATGLDIARFDHVLPFVLLSLVTEQMLSQDMPEPLDQHLWGFAKNAGKQLYGVETFGEQMEVLHKIPLETQVKMLEGMFSQIGKFRQYLLHLAGLYEAGELRRLHQLVKRNTKGMRQLVLYRRNEIMAERIGALAREQSLFATIGAAHLSGGKGVLRLLKKEGFKITPVGTQPLAEV